MIAAIVALSTGAWWVLGLVLVVHLLAFAAVMVPIGRVIDQGDKPDPVTEARLQDEGGSEADR